MASLAEAAARKRSTRCLRSLIETAEHIQALPALLLRWVLLCARGNRFFDCRIVHDTTRTNECHYGPRPRHDSNWRIPILVRSPREAGKELVQFSRSAETFGMTVAKMPRDCPVEFHVRFYYQLELVLPWMPRACPVEAHIYWTGASSQNLTIHRASLWDSGNNVPRREVEANLANHGIRRTDVPNV